MVFEQVIQRLNELGFFKFILPFIIISAIVYALLRKTKVLGESPLINGLVSMAIAFFIFGAPVLLGGGGDLSLPLGSFFKILSIVVLIIVFGLLVAGIFVPNLMSSLGGWIKGSGIIWGMVILVLVLAIISGLFNFLGEAVTSAIGDVGGQILLVILVILIFVGIILGVSSGAK